MRDGLPVALLQLVERTSGFSTARRRFFRDHVHRTDDNARPPRPL